ncbi:Methyltransferase type 11 domain protein [mine drainage metagenome]|uniref:Methyltransferase type 11 domain protein n=1 Tax=mine drainage metagenome TaxID=410659 RepID=T1CU50_9ZZZZ
MRRWLTTCGVRPGQTVADLGAGTGILLPWVLDRVGDSGTVWMVDIDPQNLMAARLGLGGTARFADRVRWLVRSAADLPEIPTGSVDLAVSFGLLCCMAEKERAVDEMYRILKPGGRALVNFHCLDLPISERARALRMTRERWRQLRSRAPWEPVPGLSRGRWIHTECLRKPRGAGSTEGP